MYRMYDNHNKSSLFPEQRKWLFMIQNMTNDRHSYEILYYRNGGNLLTMETSFVCSHYNSTGQVVPVFPSSREPAQE
jgi:hypothetical protein